MGTSYIIMRVDDGLIAWGRECGMPIPENLSGSRFPTLSEIRSVTASLEGFYSKESRGLGKTDLDIAVESFDKTEFTQENHPILGEYYGKKIFTCPARWTTLWIKISDSDEITAISFHKGDQLLAVEITHKFAKHCGPLALIAEYSGFPLFITPDKYPPDGLELW